MKKWKTSIVIFAILLTTVFALVGCALKPEEMVEKSIETWSNATEKSVTDTIDIKNLVVGATPKGVVISIPVLTVSLQAQIIRAFTATETSIEANLQLNGFSLYPLVANKLGIKLDEKVASKVKITAKIVLEGTNINITITSDGLKAFVITPATEEINYNTVVSVDANPLTANLFRDSADAISFGTILPTGKLYNDTNTYIYSIPKESALATVTSQYANIFNAVKDLSLEGGETISTMLNDIFNTSDFNSIIASIFTGSEMEVRTHLNRENKAYYFDKMSTNTHLNGSIKGETLRRILNKMSVESSLIDMLDIDKGITLSTSNSSGVTLKSSYIITKF